MSEPSDSTPCRCSTSDRSLISHRVLLSKILVGLVALIAAAAFPLAILDAQVWGQVKDYLSLILVPLFTLTSAAIGYFFSGNRYGDRCRSTDVDNGE